MLPDTIVSGRDGAFGFFCALGRDKAEGVSIAGELNTDGHSGT
jgi:hypothetical protein